MCEHVKENVNLCFFNNIEVLASLQRAPFTSVISFFKQRFIQYLASRSTLFNLNNFIDKGALQGEYKFETTPHFRCVAAGNDYRAKQACISFISYRL